MGPTNTQVLPTNRQSRKRIETQNLKIPFFIYCKQPVLSRVCVCVCACTPCACNSSVSLRIMFYLSENSSFQRLHIIHISLGKFKPSGGRFGMGCHTETYFSRTTKDFTSTLVSRRFFFSFPCGFCEPTYT